MTHALTELCGFCQRIPAKFFSFHKDKQCSINHHPSYIDLKRCAATCRLCKLLVRAVERYEGPYANTWAKQRFKESDAIRLDSTKFRQQKIAGAGSGDIGVFRGEEVAHEWNDPIEIHEDLNDEELRINDAAIIERWEKICSTSHKHCAELVGRGYMPTRLIEVGNESDQRVRLIVSNEGSLDDKRYLALSHCWGKNMPSSARTTLKALQKHCKMIEMTALTKTFQDFIMLARRLKIQYVWIDSLCIVQDSAEDWEREAAEMANVYSNAHLTISASGSADGNGGCRILDESRSYGPIDASFAEDPENPHSSNHRVFRIWCRGPSPITSTLRNDPVTARGWCLQERELSIRIVHFSTDSMRWECRDMKASSEFPWADDLTFNGALRLFDNGQLDSPTLSPKSLGKLSTQDYAKLVMNQRLVWFELVSRYTERALTRQSDILPAISGIAQAVAASLSDEYYAGLWFAFLPYCLLWSRRTSDQEVLRHSRPETYLAPSWSWASVKGAVTWSSSVGLWYNYNPDPYSRYIPEVVSIKVDPAGSDRYGTLKGGVLQLKGLMRPAFTKNEQHVKNGKEPGSEVMYVATTESLKTGEPLQVGRVTYDVPLCDECAPPGQANYIYVMACLNCTPFKDGTFKTFGLALEPADGTMMGVLSGKFRRVGLATFIEPSFWDDAMSAAISIM